jgi:hypothetical protein
MQANSFTSTYQTRIDGRSHLPTPDDLSKRTWSGPSYAPIQIESETLTERVLGFVEKYGEFTHD